MVLAIKKIHFAHLRVYMFLLIVLGNVLVMYPGFSCFFFTFSMCMVVIVTFYWKKQMFGENKYPQEMYARFKVDIPIQKCQKLTNDYLLCTRILILYFNDPYETLSLIKSINLSTAWCNLVAKDLASTEILYRSKSKVLGQSVKLFRPRLPINKLISEIHATNTSCGFSPCHGFSWCKMYPWWLIRKFSCSQKIC